jgi:hypothetical protein
VSKTLLDLGSRLYEAERKARAFDWLERRGFATCGVNGSSPGSPDVHCWGHNSGRWNWTAQWISSELDTALQAVELAMFAERTRLSSETEGQ